VNLRSEDGRVRRSIRLSKKGKNWGRRYKSNSQIYDFSFEIFRSLSFYYICCYWIEFDFCVVAEDGR